MTTERFVRGPDGKLVSVAVPTPPQEVVEVEEVEEGEVVEGETEPGAVDDVSDVVSVSEEDVLGRPEDNLDPDEDLSDLFEVSDEDIMGPAPQPEKPKPRVRRIIRRIPPTPPTTLGGIR